MKKTTIFIVSILLFNANIFSQVTDSINMTAGYALDVYYSLDNGSHPAVSNSEWTVSFSTGAQTSSIYINDGRGVELYKTNTLVSGFGAFNAADTAGLSSSWTQSYNEYQSWGQSAFEEGTTGHPNYGWGEYNSSSNIITGDKVFVLKTLTAEYYKTMVIKKDNGAWHYRYATLDNSFDTTIVYQATDLLERNFAFLNMDNHTFLNREPSNLDWDLLFTKYYDTGIMYNVTGVLLNKDVEVIQIDATEHSAATQSGGTFDAVVNEIGYDWKAFDNTTFTFVLDTLKTFFVKQNDGDIYKLFFTRFDGQSTGKTVFSKELIVEGSDPNSIEENGGVNLFSIYPNPARNTTHLLIDAKTSNDAQITIYNTIGKLVYSKKETLKTGLNDIKIDVNGFHQGVYFLKLQNGIHHQTMKFNVSK